MFGNKQKKKAEAWEDRAVMFRELAAKKRRENTTPNNADCLELIADTYSVCAHELRLL